MNGRRLRRHGRRPNGLAMCRGGQRPDPAGAARAGPSEQRAPQRSAARPQAAAEAPKKQDPWQQAGRKQTFSEELLRISYF